MPVPIIGEKVTLGEVKVVVAMELTCPCGTKMLFVGPVGLAAGCTGCGRLLHLSGLPSLQDGRIDVPVTIIAKG